MKINIRCDDKYEATKFASLIFTADKKTNITKILNIIKNELVITIPDESAHSILLADELQAEDFAYFIQSVLDKKQEIISVTVHNRDVQIVKD